MSNSELISSIFEDEEILQTTSLYGGSINEVYKVTTSNKAFVIKINTKQKYNMFIAEVNALSLIEEKTKNINVPKTHKHGQILHHSFLLMDFIDEGYKSHLFWNNFGQKLASMHKCKSNHFGLEEDNFIGSMHQANTPTENYIDFFINNRIEPLIKKTYNYFSKKDISCLNQLYKELANIIPNEAPSLIHGDLWSGNFLCNKHEEVVLIDPCTHYSHREAEISFTHMFGGFHDEFYESYHSSFPLEPDFESRIDIYNLYPYLVHLNLFGSSYLNYIVTTLNKFRN